MLRRRIRSALYIDFENVPLPPEAIANWLSWLEDGHFDPERRRRRFLQKRVYWNSHAERNRELFRRHGFVAILVGKYSGLKNGADIRMAMDVIETTYTRPEIDEFILLTGDSDFVPVVERLKHKSKRSAIVVTEHRPNIHTTYHRNADLLIPSRRLTEAAQYQRPRPSLLARLIGRKATGVPAPPTTSRPTTPPSATGRGGAGRSDTGRADAGRGDSGRGDAGRKATPSTPERATGDGLPAIEAAAQRVAKLLTQQPRNYVSHKRVLAELDRVPGFKRSGPTAYFGTGSYKALMRELARLETSITVVDQPGGGTGVVYIPPQPPETSPHTEAPVPPGPAQPQAPMSAAEPSSPARPVEIGDRHQPDSLAAALATVARSPRPDASGDGVAPRDGRDIEDPSIEIEAPADVGDDVEADAEPPRWVAAHEPPASRG